MNMTAFVLAQGDEILSGTTLDSNSNWMAQQLTQRGVQVVGMAAARDRSTDIGELLAWAAQKADLVVSSGGLGPTTDDLTAQAVAQASGQPLVLNQQAWDQVGQRYRRVGLKMPASNRKQAVLPRDATVLKNSGGTAPGFSIDLYGAKAFFFPGVPSELIAMAAQHLWPWVEQRVHSKGLVRRFHTCGVGESSLQDRLQNLELGQTTLGYKAWVPYNTVVLYGQQKDSSDFEEVSSKLASLLGEDCFGKDDTSLPAAVGHLLNHRGWSMATAESCTAGGTAALLTEAAGSSNWLAGGIISYSNKVKREQLGVAESILETHGAVSEQCAGAMATGVRRALAVDVGISITGIAGPGGGTPDKPVGMVCFGLATPDTVLTRTVKFGDRGREVVRALSSATVVDWLRRTLLKKPQNRALMD